MPNEVALTAEQEKQRAASSSVLAAVLLTALKLVVGILTGSLGILSEAAHSALDLVAALVTYFAVRLSDQPPDPEHQYGHGKIENLSALIETLLLLLTCAWILYEVVQRLFFETVEVEVSIWSFVVMGTSVIVDINRSRMLYRVAEKYDSQALEADALHFSTDIWSSLTVIGGLALVWLSDRLGPEWDWLVKADAVAALVVAIIVIFVSVQLGKRAINMLLDSAPPGLAEAITAEASRVEGVQDIGPVRVRQGGASTFVDLTIGVSRSASLEEAHLAAAGVERRVGKLIGEGDVVVHVDPVQESSENLAQTVNAVAGRLGIKAHNVHAHEVRGEYYLDFHVEVDPAMSLRDAHREASRLEDALHQELPHIREVNTHIEPMIGGPISDGALDPQTSAEMRERILEVCAQIPGLSGCHHLLIWPLDDGYDVVMHYYVDPELPVSEAHKLAAQVERQLQVQVPGISQVLVHLEPEISS